MTQHQLERLRTLGMSEDVSARLESGRMAADPRRPGTYNGCHFYDLGDSFLWASGKPSSTGQVDPCGEDLWFNPAKLEGDSATDVGTCPSGLDRWQITLVAGPSA